MFGALLATLLAGGIFFIYTRPAYDNIHVVQAQIATYDQALDKAARLQKIKQELLARYNSFSPDDKDRLQKLLPDHVDNIALILDVDHVAGTHGMSLENVDVSAAASNDTTPQQQTASSIVAASAKKYNMLTLKFSVHSTYNEFQKFMDDLQSSLRIVDLDSLTIATDQTGTGGSGGVYRYDITLRTYWLK